MGDFLREQTFHEELGHRHSSAQAQQSSLGTPVSPHPALSLMREGVCDAGYSAHVIGRELADMLPLSLARSIFSHSFHLLQPHQGLSSSFFCPSYGASLPHHASSSSLSFAGTCSCTHARPILSSSSPLPLALRSVLTDLASPICSNHACTRLWFCRPKEGNTWLSAPEWPALTHTVYILEQPSAARLCRHTIRQPKKCERMNALFHTSLAPPRYHVPHELRGSCCRPISVAHNLYRCHARLAYNLLLQVRLQLRPVHLSRQASPARPSFFC